MGDNSVQIHKVFAIRNIPSQYIPRARRGKSEASPRVCILV